MLQINDKKKSFKIIKEESNRMPDKDFFVNNGSPLWWHLLSELESPVLRSIQVVNNLFISCFAVI